jgi:hypothetical protein
VGPELGFTTSLRRLEDKYTLTGMICAMKISQVGKITRSLIKSVRLHLLFGFVIPLAVLSLGNSLDRKPDTRAFEFVFLKCYSLPSTLKKHLSRDNALWPFKGVLRRTCGVLRK